MKVRIKSIFNNKYTDFHISVEANSHTYFKFSYRKVGAGNCKV
jgi:hypothetical protein